MTVENINHVAKATRKNSDGHRLPKTWKQQSLRTVTDKELLTTWKTGLVRTVANRDFPIHGNATVENRDEQRASTM